MSILNAVVVLGLHVRIEDERFLAGFAVVDDDSVLRAVSFHAPADANEGRQLQELNGLAASLISEHGPERLAVKVNEARQKKAAATAHRAEGAAIAAAGTAGVRVHLWTHARLRGPAHLERGASPTLRACLDALCEDLTGEDISESELEQAAAAAAASIKRPSG